ncbi:MAG: AAA family ATPase [Oscillospiraceae bacterium]|nr:AAA family ATPase [Oscillospiraceae bacterium]
MEEKQMNLQKIDLIFLMRIWLRYCRRFWALALVLALLGSAAMGYTGYQTYTPVYEASVSFTVQMANPLYSGVKAYNNAMAKQLHATFPYILRSAILRQRVAEHLGTDRIPEVDTSVLENSNVFTITARDADPQMAYQVLQAVVEVYPQIADYVVGATNLVVLDDSGVPTEPVRALNLKESMALGAAAGLFVWAVCMFVLTLNRRTVHNEEELKRTLNYPCLGIVPATKVVGRGKGCPLIHTDKGKFGFSESVRLLQMHVQKEMQRKNHKLLMISGATPGEGKTTVAVNLAIAFAKKGHRVLLVDCDMYNPSVFQALKQECSKTMRDYQVGNAEATEIFVKTEVRHLYAMAANVDFKDMESKDLLQRILKVCRSSFDYVILDTPPCSLLVDAAELSDLADCAMMVIRQDYASRSQIVEGVKLLTDNGLALIGCALNGVAGNLAVNGYRYGNGYGYGYGYGSYGYGSKKKDQE